MSEETTRVDAGKGALHGAAFGFGLSIFYLVIGGVPEDADPVRIVRYMALKTVWMCYVVTVGYAIANDGVAGIVGGAAGGIAAINLLGQFAPASGLLIRARRGRPHRGPIGGGSPTGGVGLRSDLADLPRPTEHATALQPWEEDP